jgi:ribonuclease VapC
MFIDASALVSILKNEDDSGDFWRRLDDSDGKITSPIAMLETVLTLTRQKRVPVEVAKNTLEELLQRAEITVEAIDRTSANLAIDAHARYGKGSGHPARLNLGDCFAYALAKQRGVALLYKGNDFAQTDLA